MLVVEVAFAVDSSAEEVSAVEASVETILLVSAAEDSEAAFSICACTI